MKKGKIVIFFLILIIAVFAVVYIRHNNKLTQEIEKSDELPDGKTSILVINPDYFNPLISNNKYIKDLSNLVFEGLVKSDETLKAEPNLAKIIEATPDHMSYKIVLHNNIKFHSGEKFSADDVIYTVNKIKELGDKSIYKYNVENIYSVDKINNYEIKIVLNKIDNFLPEKLTFPILSKAYYENKNLETEVNYIGTGKYMVESRSNEEIILKYNEAYRKEEVGNIKKIVVKIINKNTPGFEVLKSGDVEIADTNIEVGAYGRSAFSSKRYNTGIFEALIFNLESPVVTDKNVRQAILLGINRDKIIEEYLNGYGIKSEIPVNPVSYLYDNDLPRYAYNPERAEDLLNNTGWTINNGVRIKDNVKLSINLLINSDKADAKGKAEIIKENLLNLGIEIKIVEKATGDYNYDINNKSYDMALTDWALSYYPEILYSFETNNIMNFSNEEYDYLAYLSKREILEGTLKENIYRMQAILNENLPMAGLYFRTSTVYYNKKIQGDLKSNMEDIYLGIEELVVE